jgi:predicted NAD-dependent protein-ADP-ribosyltransferase YbiA (DUF1768 family)
MGGKRTSRQVEGHEVAGRTRLAFIKNGGTYFLTELVIYADGMVDCWDLVDLDEFERKVRSGWVATTFEDGAQASAHHLASWTMSSSQPWVSADELIGEVRDTADDLAGRPDSTERCLAALGSYLDDPTKANRRALLDAYLAVPGHLRTYMLGDMDYRDWPVQAVAAGVGGNGPDGMKVSKEMYSEALEYFAERRASQPGWPQTKRGTSKGAVRPAVRVPQTVYPHGVESAPPIHGLRNSYPCRLDVFDSEFPDVETAWHALSVQDDDLRATIAAAARPYDAMKLAEDAPKRPGWDALRESVMLTLLRAKYSQNPLLAEVLLETDDREIHYDEFTSSHWGTKGRNWMGRLLELVRSELHAHRAGLAIDKPML